MKRKPHTAHENHERWLVSYADFITLLFAFFVVMFAAAQQDKSKAKEVSAAVREALENGQLSAALAGVFSRSKQPAHATQTTAVVLSPSMRAKPASQSTAPALATQPDLIKSAEILTRALAEELSAGKVQVQLNRRGLVVSLREAGFFASGDDRVAPSSYRTIEKIAAVVGPLPNPIRLEGNTDSVPIHTLRFRSNWELSAARSIAMLELLRDRFDIPDARMALAGYADTAPADTNDTEEGRAHNRRVDLVLLSAEALRSEPATSGSSAAPTTQHR
jgi:chemotaxis protein MotB